MQLIEYFIKEGQQFRAFFSWWNTNHKTNPYNFPLEMEPGEWDEQYTTYKEMVKDAKQSN